MDSYMASKLEGSVIYESNNSATASLAPGYTIEVAVMILFLSSALFFISSFHATSPFPGSLCYAYHHYLLILGPLTFTVHAL